jgi:uncharacterized protein (TIGR00290 family)
MKRSWFNWSGGKDSALALWHILQGQEYSVEALLTSFNASHDRISMHGIRRSLLEAQVRSLKLPLTTIELSEQPGMDEYEAALMKQAMDFKSKGIGYSIYGDIFLEDLRQYRENQMTSMGIDCVFPLWKRDTKELINEFLSLGFKTMVVCVDSRVLDQSFCGRIIDNAFLDDLPANVDPCGENGEFHTFVFEGPVFSAPIKITAGEKVYREYKAPGNAGNYGFWFQDLL